MSEKKTNKSISIRNRKSVGKGDIICKQGEKGNTAYLIQKGKVRIYAEHGGKTKDLAVLGPGEIFGEMALVVDDPRTASVEAIENTNLIVITRPMMIEKMAKSDVTIQALMKMLIKRIKESNLTALNQKDSFDDLISSVEAVYDNIHAGLQGAQKTSLERSVQPSMKAFIKSISDFRDSYGDN